MKKKIRAPNVYDPTEESNSTMTSLHKNVPKHMHLQHACARTRTHVSGGGSVVVCSDWGLLMLS